MWLKADSGGFGSVVVVLVVRCARRGRRKVGGTPALGWGNCKYARRRLRLNMLDTV